MGIEIFTGLKKGETAEIYLSPLLFTVENGSILIISAWALSIQEVGTIHKTWNFPFSFNSDVYLGV